MPTQYIVIERSYIYNDETYDRSEGGEPRKLFDTLEEAQKYARQLNLETFESHSHLYEVHEDYCNWEAAQKLPQVDWRASEPERERQKKVFEKARAQLLKESFAKQGPLDIFFVLPIDA